MKNTYDYPYHNEKKELAEQIGEITSVWYCGVKNRKNAMNHDVTSWRDPRCDSTVLGHKGRIAETVDTILKVNRNQDQLIYIGPPFLETGLHKKTTQIEYFIDFETINSVVDEPTVPISNDYNMIYMIGIGYQDLSSGKWVYKDFTVSKCNGQEEVRILREAIEYMYNQAEEPIGMYPLQPTVYHWSHIEKTLFDKKVVDHPELNGYKIDNWVDLCKVFTNTPIVPKGALSFGLKEVARAMYQNKLIESYWDADNSCSNGLESMVIFKHIRDQAQKEGKDIRQVPLLKDIVDYNELDCKVMWEMLGFLRKETETILKMN